MRVVIASKNREALVVIGLHLTPSFAIGAAAVRRSCLAPLVPPHGASRGKENLHKVQQGTQLHCSAPGRDW
eukprot:303215-Amphidinium_carterae.1